MNIRCIAVENYKLTLDREYEVHNESRDFYTIINDNGVGVRYAKRLFSTEPEPVAVPARTEADMVTSITFNNNRVEYTDLNGDVKTIESRFRRQGCRVSCGVNEIQNINAQISVIDRQFDLDEDDYITIRKALLRRCIEEFVLHSRNAGNQAFALMSTNVTGTDDGSEADEDMLMVLDELAHRTSDTMLNPNSGRNIRVWIMQYRR